MPLVCFALSSRFRGSRGLLHLTDTSPRFLLTAFFFVFRPLQRGGREGGVRAGGGPAPVQRRGDLARGGGGRHAGGAKIGLHAA
eukprot:8039527-Pyramimonas_sp.AAC.1